jgi:YegS/Rv2252/BmrU family lipid kinase
MKHYFLINPAAGKGKLCGSLETDIRALCGSRRIDYEIYYTKCVGDAEDYIRMRCKQENGECRFYACGGDGTINEAVNGAAGFRNASVGVVPIGTGNDFVRNFSNSEKFFDIGAQIDGETVNVDLLRYNGRLAANTLNIGFDAEVVKTVLKIKRNPAVPTKLAYILGALYQLIKKPGVKMRVSVDGRADEEKDLLLACIGNGAFCGGGFHSGPYAGLSDGIIDVCFAKNVTRSRFMGLLASYRNGTYLAKKGIDKIIEYVKCRKMDIKLLKPQTVSIDGELRELDRLTIESVPDALRFCLPQGCEIIKPPDDVCCAAVKKYVGESY